eukprot:795150-Rhodomonas_salina.2
MKEWSKCWREGGSARVTVPGSCIEIYWKQESLAGCVINLRPFQGANSLLFHTFNGGSGQTYMLDVMSPVRSSCTRGGDGWGGGWYCLAGGGVLVWYAWYARAVSSSSRASTS